MPHIKIGLVRVLSVIYKTFHKNFRVTMYYVNRKIKNKNTIGLAQRIVIFLHCSFSVKCLGGRGRGVALNDEWAAILIVFCCCLLLIAICTNCRLEHYKIREKSDLIYIWMKAWNRSVIALNILES